MTTPDFRLSADRAAAKPAAGQQPTTVVWLYPPTAEVVAGVLRDVAELEQQHIRARDAELAQIDALEIPAVPETQCALKARACAEIIARRDAHLRELKALRAEVLRQARLWRISRVGVKPKPAPRRILAIGTRARAPRRPRTTASRSSPSSGDSDSGPPHLRAPGPCRRCAGDHQLDHHYRTLLQLGEIRLQLSQAENASLRAYVRHLEYFIGAMTRLTAPSMATAREVRHHE